VIQSASGSRSVRLRDFHTGPYETVVAEGEMLVEVRVPVRPGTGSAYEKVHRRAGDWAVAAAGTFVQLQSGVLQDVGIGLAALGADHFTCAEAEELLRGNEPTAEHVRSAAAICRDSCHPQTDQRGPEDYKRHLAAVLVERSLNRSISRARGEGN
jgi:carbon-monoxide dehydrogenase medium subunit